MGDGKSIVEKQQKHKWSKSVVEALADDLQKEFPGMSGLMSRNVWRMWMFYVEYENCHQWWQKLAGARGWFNGKMQK